MWTEYEKCVWKSFRRFLRVYYWACGTFYDSSLAPTEKLWLRGSNTHLRTFFVFCIYVSVCSGWETFRSCELRALLRVYESEQCGNWIVKLFVLSIKTFEDYVHAFFCLSFCTFVSTTSTRLVCVSHVCMCILHVGVRVCSYVPLFLCATSAAFFRASMSMFTSDCVGGCAWSLWGPLNESSGLKLSVRPLTLAHTISFLISSLTPCPGLPSSTCHFPLLKGTALPREVRKRGFLHIKLKRGLSSCSRLLPSSATSLVLVQSSENSHILYMQHRLERCTLSSQVCMWVCVVCRDHMLYLLYKL